MSLRRLHINSYGSYSSIHPFTAWPPAALPTSKVWVSPAFLFGGEYKQGKVLEISAGTGRSLPHYTYENVSSLTVTDLSKRMLEQAETKFFDELRCALCAHCERMLEQAETKFFDELRRGLHQPRGSVHLLVLSALKEPAPSIASLSELAQAHLAKWKVAKSVVCLGLAVERQDEQYMPVLRMGQCHVLNPPKTLKKRGIALEHLH
eukprot:scaffold17855_cov23-Tisochrysis_lutea.AAC.1